MQKKTIAVLFGGRSPEHEISIITGIQVLNALDNKKYNILPIYVTKKGKWVLGDKSFFRPDTFKNIDLLSNKKPFFFSTDPEFKGLISESFNLFTIRRLLIKKVDIVFIAFHGRNGEDGSIQGLLELADIPYTGCDIQTSAIGIDKMTSKKIAQSVKIPVLSDMCLFKRDWITQRKGLLSEVNKKLKFPLFVKPARLGSSIAVARASNNRELIEALDVAFFYDSKVLVEKCLENAKEVNISILGNDPYQVSVCEMPVSAKGLLTFDDKYNSQKGQSKGMASAKRIVPAPIKERTRAMIERYAKDFFLAIGGQGIARVDFLVSEDERKIYFNEINTLPGSVAYYLWEKGGLSFTKLLDKLILLGLERYEDRKKLLTTFPSNVLAGFQIEKGLKG